mmetsp:Transcript_27309/g.62652  ORF Transcript_27309/g.62652 Transcript_27309/m.62652 type:complete len:87 (+) Transcript_27309:677-937(+)
MFRGGVRVGTLALSGEDYVYWRERDFTVMCTVAHNMLLAGVGLMTKSVTSYEKQRQFRCREEKNPSLPLRKKNQRTFQQNLSKQSL